MQRNEHGLVIPAERRAALIETAQLVDRATALVRDRGEKEVDGIVHATGEVLAALSRGGEGHTPGPLTDLAGRYDRAARIPQHVVPTDMGLIARELRHAARRLGALGILTGRGQEKLATAALVLALASLVAEIAAWQQLHGRVPQAAAARSAADVLPAVAGTAGVRRPPLGRPVQPSAAMQPVPSVLRRQATGHHLLPRPRSRGPG